MKTHKKIAVFIVLWIILFQSADAVAVQEQPSWYNLLLIALICVAVTLLVITYFLFRLVQAISDEINKDPEKEAFKKAFANQGFWARVFQLYPLNMESKLLIDESHDGIYELNNPTPPWFMFLFYFTIAFSLVYMFIYHVAGDGNVQESEYVAEVAQAKEQIAAYRKANAKDINEDNVVWLTDATAIEEGKQIYSKYCVACHGARGEGKVGPNLTDDYWLHGGTAKNLFHTISEGVPQKGMISWKNQLSPQQIQYLVSFVRTLKGTNPENPKAPEGELFVEGAVSENL